MKNIEILSELNRELLNLIIKVQKVQLDANTNDELTSIYYDKHLLVSKLYQANIFLEEMIIGEESNATLESSKYVTLFTD